MDITAIVDKVIKDEYGGCHPTYDNPCRLKTRMSRGVIEVFVVGKWRGIRSYSRNTGIPSRTIMQDVERSVRRNTGRTFDGKIIEFVWEK